MGVRLELEVMHTQIQIILGYLEKILRIQELIKVKYQYHCDYSLIDFI